MTAIRAGWQAVTRKFYTLLCLNIGGFFATAGRFETPGEALVKRLAILVCGAALLFVVAALWNIASRIRLAAPRGEEADGLAAAGCIGFARIGATFHLGIWITRRYITGARHYLASLRLVGADLRRRAAP